MFALTITNLALESIVFTRSGIVLFGSATQILIFGRNNSCDMCILMMQSRIVHTHLLYCHAWGWQFAEELECAGAAADPGPGPPEAEVEPAPFLYLSPHGCAWVWIYVGRCGFSCGGEDSSLYFGGGSTSV